MIITLEKYNNYFGTSLDELPFGLREEKTSLNFLYATFPNLPMYETLTIETKINDFEYILMEQINYTMENEQLTNAPTNITSFSIEGYSQSTDINKKYTTGGLTSSSAYNMLVFNGWAYMGICNK
jgi:hypothetical protein